MHNVLPPGFPETIAGNSQRTREGRAWEVYLLPQAEQTCYKSQFTINTLPYALRTSHGLAVPHRSLVATLHSDDGCLSDSCNDGVARNPGAAENGAYAARVVRPGDRGVMGAFEIGAVGGSRRSDWPAAGRVAKTE